MKKGRFLTSLSLIAVLLTISGTTFAQRGQRGQAGRMAPMEQLNLSEEQREKLNTLRADHQKEMRYENNLLQEKNARLSTLLSAPERDETAVNNTIDQIAEMKAGLMKKRIAHQEEAKTILSPEQIDKMETLGAGKRGPHNMRGMRSGIGQAGNRGFHDRGLFCPYN